MVSQECHGAAFGGGGYPSSVRGLARGRCFRLFWWCSNSRTFSMPRSGARDVPSTTHELQGRGRDVATCNAWPVKTAISPTKKGLNSVLRGRYAYRAIHGNLHGKTMSEEWVYHLHTGVNLPMVQIFGEDRVTAELNRRRDNRPVPVGNPIPFADFQRRPED